MNYHPDDFFSLIEETEAQGGVHISSETCVPSHFRLNLPIDEDNPQGPKKNTRISTTGCNRRAKLLVALLPDAYIAQRAELATADFDFDDTKHARALMSDGETPAMAKVCAVDDAMGLWPRFQDAMTTGESFEPSG